MTTRVVRLGVVGLGRGFTLMLPTFLRDARFELVAAATPGQRARAAFEAAFDGRAYETAADMFDDGGFDAVYVASPHQFHCEHVLGAVAAGVHVLIDKPLAISLEEGERMVAAAASAGVHLIVGPSHAFDAPVLEARALVESGRYGEVRMIHAFNYTDFLYRPRRIEELDTGRGGGVVFSQAVHQVDVARLLAGGLALNVRAITGSWDPARPTEGAYSALLEFAGGAFASLTYSGYGRFDSDEFMDWIGELGHRKNPEDYGRARRLLAESPTATDEVEAKRARNFGQVPLSRFRDAPLPDAHEHFGVVIVSLEGADLRLKADGVMIFGDASRDMVRLDPPAVPRVEVMDELYAAVVEGRPPLHSGAWGLASLEAAVAILVSATEHRTVSMQRQVSAGRVTS
jgi:phthalate 4,5-cis-dihydrodiol dehydrogenase